MKNTILTFCCILLQQSLFAENKDWLIDGSPYKTEVNLSSDKKQIGSRACHQWKRVSSRRFGRAACP